MGEYAEMSLEELLSVQVVTAASRRAQSMHESPSSISLLTYEDIEAMRGLNVAQPFRRLLGVYVEQKSANAYQLIVRNDLDFNNNEVPVLLDGRNTVQQIFGFSPWTWLPLMPEELESAEVIRGPGGVTYGANTTGGVVSLRTRRPLDHPGLEGRVRTGLMVLPDADNTPDGPNLAGMASLGNVAYNYANDARTFGVRMSLGARGLPDLKPAVSVPPKHGQYGYYGLLGIEARPNQNSSLYGTVTHSQIEHFDPTLSARTGASVNMQEQAVTLNYEHRALAHDHVTVRSNWDFTRQHISAGANASKAFVYHGLAQADLTLWEGRSVTTIGGEFSQLGTDVAGNISPSATSLGLMLQDELHLVDRRLILSAAVRFDRIAQDTGRDLTLYYRNPTARGSIIWRFVPDQDIRLTVANAYRTPLPLQSSIGGYFNAPVPGEAPVGVVLPNPSLRPSKVRLVELGYRADLFEHLRVDAVFALTDVTDPVFSRTARTLPILTVNGDKQNFIRGELGITAKLRKGSEAFVNYVGVRSTRENASDPEPSYIPHHINLGASTRFQNGVYLQGDLEMYYGTKMIVDDPSGLPLLTSTVDAPDLYDVNLRFGRWILDDKVDVFLECWNFAGFFRDQPRLIRHAVFPDASPLPGMILAGIGLRNQ